MNWLLPGFLVGGALVGLPVILHFLRRKPKTLVRFPSLRFLGETAIRDTRKHRLRRWLTLALRCLIIALLAAAFARPFWVAADAAHRRVMIVAVDNSMSMQAGDRWADRKQWALRQLGELQEGDQAGVLLMNPTPTWLVPISNDLAHGRDAVQQSQPGFEKTSYSAALRFAGEMLALNPAGEKVLVWMADEQWLGWRDVKIEQALPAGVKIRFAEAAPEPKRQAAITAAHIEMDGEKQSLAINVRLYRPEKEERKLTVSDGDRVLETRVIKLSAGENKIIIPLPADVPASSAGFRISMEADELPADDTAWVSRAEMSAHPVWLDQTAEVDFLKHALQSTRRLNAGAMEPSALPPSDWPQGGVAILRDASSFQTDRAARLEKFLRAGGGAWIFVDGTKAQADWLSTHGVQIKARILPIVDEEPMHLRDWDPEHPVLGGFRDESLLPLMQVEFYRGFDLKGDNLVPVARWPDGGIALAEISVGSGRIFLAGMPLDRKATNWPALPSFVPFVHQTVRWLGSVAAKEADWRVGDTIPLAGEGTWRVLDSPVQAVERRVSGSVRAEAPGLYEFLAGEKKTFFAVNIPTEESDLRPWQNMDQLLALESKEHATQSRAAVAPPIRLSNEAAEARQRLWSWLLALCAAGMLAELALANRTTM
ncbi:MAG: hypothetical protein QOD99_2760 [Chthoniobacter sp.]|jgi:hypothetical protein|nr:hypothetical protein [Chthoniobacter sp.]